MAASSPSDLRRRLVSLPEKAAAKKNWEVAQSEGKGMGLFATADIPYGHPVFCEGALVTGRVDGTYLNKFMFMAIAVAGFAVTDWQKACGWMVCVMMCWRFGDLEYSTRHIYKQVLALKPEEADAFFGLSSCFGGNDGTRSRSNVYNIYKTNRVCMTILPEGDVIGDGVFPVFSRLNHSCSPNLFHLLDPKTKRKVLFTTRNVKKGEELTITYADDFGSRASRQSELAEKYKFTCDCPACALPAEARGDANRREAKAIIDRTFELAMGSTPADEDVGATALRAINLLEEEGAGCLFTTHMIAECVAEYYKRFGDKKLAKEWDATTSALQKALKGAMSAAKEVKAWSS